MSYLTEQGKRLETSDWATMAVIATVGSDGKEREMCCLAVESVAMWLGTLQNIKDPQIKSDHLLTTRSF